MIRLLLQLIDGIQLPARIHTPRLDSQNANQAGLAENTPETTVVPSYNALFTVNVYTFVNRGSEQSANHWFTTVGIRGKFYTVFQLARLLL